MNKLSKITSIKNINTINCFKISSAKKNQERQEARKQSTSQQTYIHQTSKTNILKPTNQSMTGPQIQNRTLR